MIEVRAYAAQKAKADLAHQPDDIKGIINQTIQTAITANKNISQVGIRLMKFCNLFDLKKISDQAQSYSEPLNARYTQ